jgi:hypothetical protein
MVDWFFMHIDQETGNIYHHQTCQAKKDGTTGPIGTLANTKQLLNSIDLDKHIICPNQRCGCGMCIPKAKELGEYELIFREHV